MNVKNLQARSEIIKLIRRFFDKRGYLEMHTPRLVGVPGQEPHLEPFWTTVTNESLKSNVESRKSGTEKTLDFQTFDFGFPAALITSPEYMMKRLLAAGFEKIYDLGPCFRNGEPWDGTHDPEFLLLEWYRKDADLNSLMDETEEMVKWVVEKSKVKSQKSKNHDSDTRTFNFQTFRLSTPFRRLTVEDAWKEYASIELAPLLDNRDAMAKLCRERNQTVTDSDTWDDLYFKIFLSEIEPKIAAHPIQTFLYRYPASMAALARRSSNDPRWADRVELYMGGLELANGFAELSDPIEQRKRFEEDRALRHKLGKKTWDLDERFLSDLPKMGNAAGIAFGVDRFVMLLTGSKSINDVIPSSARERFGG